MAILSHCRALTRSKQCDALRVPLQIGIGIGVGVGSSPLHCCQFHASFTGEMQTKDQRPSTVDGRGVTICPTSSMDSKLGPGSGISGTEHGISRPHVAVSISPSRKVCTYYTQCSGRARA